MKRFLFSVALAAIAIAPCVRAQSYTAEQILANLDTRAKAFTSIQASIAKQDVTRGFRPPVQTGNLTMALSPGTPRILFDITSTPRTRALIDKGKATVYYPDEKTYRQGNVDPKEGMLMLLLLGFGTPADTIRKGYKAAEKGTETVGGVKAVVLELTSISPTTSEYPIVTLWLDPATWTPARTRVAKSEITYYDFSYSKVQLNMGTSNSTFDLKIPKEAKRQ